MADSFVLSNDFRGGRCKDIPTFLGTTQCAEAINVDFFYSRCGNKRWGTQLQYEGLAVGPTQNLSWGSLIRHQPGIIESEAELWAFNHGDPIRQFARAIGSGSPTYPTAFDPINQVLPPKACGAEVRGATFNGKLFLCYDSDVDRLHVWDPATGTNIRRVGLPQPTPPTLSAQNPTGFTDTRKYRACWVSHVGPVVTARSDLSDFTIPYTCANQQLVFWHQSYPNPPHPNEPITGWELYGYSDDDAYATGHMIARTTIGTQIVDAQVVMLGDPPPEIGLNTPPTSWKYIMVHGNRLLGAGSWEQPGLNNRVWFTAPLGSGDSPGDDERVPQTLAQQNYLDLDENDGGYIVGFGGMMNGSPVVFKTNGIYRLIPTGNAANPYQIAATPISRVVGAIRQEAIIPAEDENGNPAIYWLAHNGPHRYTATKGVEYCGYDIEDIWQATNAGDGYAQPHGIWYPQKKQVWWYLGNANTPVTRVPNFRLVLHTQFCHSTGQGARGGWAWHTTDNWAPNGHAMVCLASVLYASPLDFATGIPLRPMVSYGLPAGVGGLLVNILACDIPGLLTDLGVYYQSYVLSPAYMLGGLANRFTSMEPLFLARRSPFTAIGDDARFGANLSRDFGEETLWDDITQPHDDITVGPLLDLNPLGEAFSIPLYQVRRMALAITGAHVAQIAFGDVGVRTTDPWNRWWGIEAVMVQRTPADERG